MTVSPEALSAIALMALATYAIRVGGLLLADRLPREGFVAAWLRHIPGAVLAALVAPAIASGSIAEAVAAAVTALVFIATRSLFPAMAAGVVAVYIARLFV
ncbi:AzlD domain-containing protein [Devosia nitrariae]|uniref:AzlD domain-containing protein n=1 Tax=Devosia nitrariae TaxID=2071872 RepID=A0ABQ5W2C7_9HYPH|nr:AzlD domain-containing protein [Devosia nitrariae]GLQ54178.1 hypothetical protein GCM10010862_14370 [Devosia nitrariae]